MAAPEPCFGLARRDPVVDRQSGAVPFVAEHDGGAGAWRVARDVRERFLRAAVEHEARVGRKRPRLALDAQRHVDVQVGSVAVDQRVELSEARQFVATQGSHGLPRIHESGLDELGGAIDRCDELRRCLLAVGEHPCALELDRGAGEGVGEHVVKLARDPATLGDRGGTRLLLARVLQLCEQHLGPVLALTRPPKERRNESEQYRHQRSRNNGGRGTSRERGDDSERHGHHGGERDSGEEWQPRHCHEHRGARRDLGRSSRLEAGECDTASAHRCDHGCLDLDAKLREAIPDRDSQHAGERAQGERYRQRLAVHTRGRVTVRASDHDDDDHRQAQWAQRVALAVQALCCSRVSFRHPVAGHECPSIGHRGLHDRRDPARVERAGSDWLIVGDFKLRLGSPSGRYALLGGRGDGRSRHGQ